MRRIFHCLLLTACCLLLFGCRQDMQDQPRYEAYESSTFFKDGLASRRLVEGTIPRGYLRADRQLYTGKLDAGARAGTQANAGAAQGGAEAGAQMNANTNAEGSAGAQANGNAQGNANASSQGGAAQAAPAGEADDADTFPFAVTEDVVKRGKERYQIFCSMCHGPVGEGDGMIVRRGYRQPPSYHEDRLRQARVGYFFRVMTEGFGAMPSYKSQIPVQDRWAIAAYVRALQLSQMNLRSAPAPSGGAAAPAETGGHR
ncbi:MAG TPA: cytochrome c [Pyrinomonadaceae bacterium]|nr:cytochrome c [Pyrinomonadaceae bacterium]